MTCRDFNKITPQFGRRQRIEFLFTGGVLAKSFLRQHHKHGFIMLAVVLVEKMDQVIILEQRMLLPFGPQVAKVVQVEFLQLVRPG